MTSCHKNRVSEELPDYLLGKFELMKPAVRERTHVRGRNAILSQVSVDAPANFQLPFVQPSTPSARRALFLASSPATTPRDLRLLSDLHTSRHQDYTSFNYVDFDPSRTGSVDYNSMPLSKAADLEKGNDAGTRRKLPFYERHARAAENRGFHMRMGMFSHRANQRVVGRADLALKVSLQSTIRTRKEDKSTSQETSPRHSQSPKGLSLMSKSRPTSIDTRALKVVLNASLRKRGHGRAQSVAPVSISQEIDSFDIRRALDLSFHPVTKKALGTIV